MSVVSILLVYTKKNLDDNIKTIEYIINKSEKTYLLNYGDDDFSDYNYFHITKTDTVFAEINKIMKANTEFDIHILDFNIIPQQQNYLEIFENYCSTNTNSVCTGSLVYEDDTCEDNILFSSGNKLITRENYFFGDSKINYGQSLSTLLKSDVQEIDSVDYLFFYIPQEIVNQQILFDESIEIFLSKSVIIDDFCFQLKTKGFLLKTIPVVYGKICLDDFEYDYPDKLIDIYTKFWMNKWGWNLQHPDLNFLRKKYFNKKIIKSINEDLINDVGKEPRVDIFIEFNKNIELVKRTVESIFKSKYKNYNIVVFSNGNIEKEEEQLNNFIKNNNTHLKGVSSKIEIGNSSVFNWLFLISSAPVVLNISAGIELSEESISSMLKMFERYPYASVVSPKVFDSKKEKLYYAGVLDNTDNIQLNNFIAKTNIVSNDCVMYKRKAIEKVGMMEIDLANSDWENIDLAYRIYKCGYEIIYNGKISVIQNSQFNSTSLYNLKKKSLLKSWFLFKHKIYEENYNKIEELLEK